jgi:anti-anti-sigma factor
MQVTMSREGSVTIVKPVGPLVAGELDGLERQLQQLLRDWAKRVVLSLSETNLIDSAGLELLCHYHQRLTEQGLRLKLSGVTDTVQKTLDLTRLSRRFEIHSDTAAAVRSFL